MNLGASHAPEILGLLRLLYLSVAIAAADGTVNESELTIFHDAVGKRVTDPTTLEMFSATEAALLRDTGVANRLVSKIAKGVKPAKPFQPSSAYLSMSPVRMRLSQVTSDAACCG